jgi:hypothetical protein
MCSIHQFSHRIAHWKRTIEKPRTFCAGLFYARDSVCRPGASTSRETFESASPSKHSTFPIETTLSPQSYWWPQDGKAEYAPCPRARHQKGLHPLPFNDSVRAAHVQARYSQRDS